MKKMAWTCWILAVTVLLACGCAQKLTYERWQTIRDGDSSAAVQVTLGKPWQETGMTWVYNDSDRGITSFIYFEDDKVTGKTWQDATHGMVGTSPEVTQPGEAENIKIEKIE